jgi:hypothetical protein
MAYISFIRLVASDRGARKIGLLSSTLFALAYAFAIGMIFRNLIPVPEYIAVPQVILITRGPIGQVPWLVVIGRQAKTVDTVPAAECPKVGLFQGMKAPDTAFVTVDGKKLRLSELRGRFVVIWFMAAWCPSCAAVGPLIKDAVKGRADVAVIVVDLWTR